MNKNDIIQLDITDIAVGGEGVGKLDGFPFFVKNAVTGDKVSAVITKLKKNYGYAKVIGLIEPSPYRVEPACDKAEQCGGCQIMQLSYEKQIEFKAARVKRELEKTGGLSFAGEDAPEFHHIIGMDGDRLHFRNKMQMPVGVSKDGRVIAGFYAGRTHYIIETKDCPVAPEETGRLAEAICAFMEERGISVYDETTGKGLVRHIMIRKGHRTGQLMVCLVINGKRLEGSKAAAEDSDKAREEKGTVLFSHFDGHQRNKRERQTSIDAQDNAVNPDNNLEQQFADKIVKTLGNKHGTSTGAPIITKFDPIRDDGISISLNYNTKQTNVIMGSEGRSLYGNMYIEDVLSLDMEGMKDLRFRISPLSFYQVNSVQAEKLYAKAIEFAELKGSETVWDLYCGIGTISLFLAQKAKKVYGVEIVPQAIEDARVNAKLNGIENAEFICGDAADIFTECCDKSKQFNKYNGERTDIMVSDNDMTENSFRDVETAASLFMDQKPADVVFLDPPRKGCDKKLLEAVMSVAPEKIIYISCDPATLARDINILTNGEAKYKVEHVQPVDLFLNTWHVETVVLLSKGEISTKNIRVEFPLEKMDMSGFQQGATYDEIKKYVFEQYGLKVSSLFIAQIKRKCGLEMGENYNLPKDENGRVPQCTPEKEAAIMDALRHFHMIG